MVAPHSIIRRLEFWPVDIPMTEPFVVATGRRTVAENMFVRLTLDDGVVGYGEMAPFPEVGGERRDTCLDTAQGLAKVLIGRSVRQYRALASELADAAPDHPAVRCGLETAMLDALCREANLPLWAFWGGADVRAHETDITIPITTIAKTLTSGEAWYGRGFRLFKTKVGANVDEDLARLYALHRALPDVAFIADGNQGFTEGDCRRFLEETQRHGFPVVLMEQPLVRDDLDGMAALQRDYRVPIAADESARSPNDLQAVIRTRAAQVINIKIMKSGLCQALDMAITARRSGLGLMSGGMVETRVAMACSFAMVLGLGGFDWIDLDTPLLMTDDPVEHGYRYDGPRLEPAAGPGLDLSVMPTAPVTVTPS